MAATDTTASTVPSTATAAAAAAAAEAASVQGAATTAPAETASVQAMAADDKQDVEKLTKFGSSLTTKGKFKGLILKMNCEHLQKLFLFFFTDSSLHVHCYSLMEIQ